MNSEQCQPMWSSACNLNQSQVLTVPSTGDNVAYKDGNSKGMLSCRSPKDKKSTQIPEIKLERKIKDVTLTPAEVAVRGRSNSISILHFKLLLIL